MKDIFNYLWNTSPLELLAGACLAVVVWVLFIAVAYFIANYRFDRKWRKR